MSDHDLISLGLVTWLNSQKQDIFQSLCHLPVSSVLGVTHPSCSHSWTLFCHVFLSQSNSALISHTAADNS